MATDFSVIQILENGNNHSNNDFVHSLVGGRLTENSTLRHTIFIINA